MEGRRGRRGSVIAEKGVEGKERRIEREKKGRKGGDARGIRERGYVVEISIFLGLICG